MHKWVWLVFAVIKMSPWAACSFAQVDLQCELCWSSLPAIPNAKGLAGPFVGMIGEQLFVAGGANFPDNPPWDGGTKKWSEAVYSLNVASDAAEQKRWQRVGELPKRLAYGVSITTSQGIICIGGSDDRQHYSDVFELSVSNGVLDIRALPALPLALANCCGALVGDSIFVAGGNTSPDATTAMKKFWSLDLSNPLAPWCEHEPWPGPGRILAVAGTDNESFFLFSGAELLPDANGKANRSYLRDAYRFHPERGWKKLADMPRAAVAAPSPAPFSADGRFLILGGDDGSLVGLQQLDQHPGFPKSAILYDSIADHWPSSIPLDVSRVTTTIVRHQDSYILPTGEVRPGVRSPDVWKFRWNPQADSASQFK